MSATAGSVLFPNVAATRPAINPWIVAATVTLATLMELLDTAIANVALPHIGRVRPAAIATASKLFGGAPNVLE
jgi:hypothetical protein